MRKALLLLVFLFFAESLSAKDSLDNRYIQRFTDQFAIAGILKQKTFDFTLRSRPGYGNFRRDFRPNNNYSAGIGFFIFDVNIELTGGIPLSERSYTRFGITETRDLQMNVITNKLGVELYSQRYEGFYVVNPSANVIAPQPFPQRSDLESRNVGYSMVYVFNPKRYSLPATYTFAERQLKSQGTFLLQTSLSSWILRTDTALVSSAIRDAFGTGASLTQGAFTSLDLGPGYAHNLIFKGFFLNLTLFMAPSHTWMKYEESNRLERYDIQINFSSGVRAAVGYNSDKFYAGLSLTNQAKVISFTETELINNRRAIKFVLGFRFEEKGILQKSAIDLLPKGLHFH